MSLEELFIYGLNVIYLVEFMGKFVKCKELVLGGMGWYKGINNYIYSYVYSFNFLCFLI